jgi:hypothetical protein
MPGSAPTPVLLAKTVEARRSWIILRTDARNLSLGVLSPVEVGPVEERVSVVDRCLVVDITVGCPLTGGLGAPVSAPVSGSSRSGVSERPSSSLKLFSRGIKYFKN